MTEAAPVKTIATKTRPSWEKALSFSRAAGSLLANLGPADEATRARRLASCHACDKIERAPDGLEYCGECDCGRWPLSRLDAKLAFPYLECPLGKPGFSNEGETPATATGERKKCSGCAMPDPDRSLIVPGTPVIITAKLPGENIDRRQWRVESSRGAAPDKPNEPLVYEIKRRRRRFTWDWLRHWFRPERATVSRDALARAVKL